MISANELNVYVRTLIEEEQPGSWKTGHVLQAMNLAIDWVFLLCFRAHERYRLREGEINITQTDVDNGKRIYDMPNPRTIYISQWFDHDKGQDFRPYISKGCPLVYQRDYDFPEMDKFEFFEPFISPQTLHFCYKALPPRLTSLNGFIELEDVYFNFLVEVVLIYLRRQDETVQPEQFQMINHFARDVRRALNSMPGRIEQLRKTEWGM